MRTSKENKELLEKLIAEHPITEGLYSVEAIEGNESDFLIRSLSSCKSVIVADDMRYLTSMIVGLHGTYTVNAIDGEVVIKALFY